MSVSDKENIENIRLYKFRIKLEVLGIRLCLDRNGPLPALCPGGVAESGVRKIY